jgi:hypothetical protein
MLDTKLSIKDYVQRVALPADRFHFHKKQGKLTGYVPSAGQLIVLDGFEEIGEILRSPNSVKDFTARLSDGTIIRKNLVNKDIEGYIDQ